MSSVDRFGSPGGRIALCALSFLLQAGCGKGPPAKVLAGARPIVKTTRPPRPPRPPTARVMVKPTRPTAMKAVRRTRTSPRPVAQLPRRGVQPMVTVEQARREAHKRPLGPSILRAITLGYALKRTDQKCADFGLKDMFGYSLMMGKKQLKICDPEEVYDLDCTIFGDAAAPAYAADDSGNATIECVDPQEDPAGPAPVDPDVLDAAIDAFSFATGFPCSQAQSEQRDGYCDGEHLMYCKDDELRALDCDSLGAGVTCGAALDLVTGPLLSCVGPVSATLDPAIAEIADFAYDTGLECGADAEGRAACDESYLSFCKGGTVQVLDCATFEVVDGQAATCGEQPDNAVGCLYQTEGPATPMTPPGEL